MQSFDDFCEWMGTQKRAGDALGVSEATVSRLRSGVQPLTAEIAERCEAVSHGLFRKEKILWPDQQATAA